jgi:hypothetical protein
MRSREVSIDEVHKLRDNDMFIRKILEFYAHRVAHIEILKDGIPQPHFFPILPYCNFSSDAPKEKFKRECNRTNAKTKCESLMKESKFFIIDLRVNYWLKTGLTRFIGLLQQYLDMVKSLLGWVCLFLNLIILFSYTNETGTRTEEPILDGTSVEFTEAFLTTLGSITLLLIFLIYSNSLINKIPVKITRFQAAEDEKEKKSKKTERLENHHHVKTALTKIREIFLISISILSDLHLLYYLTLLLMTILGVSYHPFFYTYLLTYIILRTPALMNVLQAIWYPRETLFLTMVLMSMVIYALTVFSFWSYADEYNDND